MDSASVTTNVALPSVEELAECFKRLQERALATRRYFHVGVDMNESHAPAVAPSFFVNTQIGNARWKQSLKPDLISALDHVIKLADKPLKESWVFDPEHVAEEFLALCHFAANDKRIRSVVFRADFRKVRDAKLFKSWIKGLQAGSNGHYTNGVLSGVRSDDAAESIRLTRLDVTNLLKDYPSLEEIIDKAHPLALAPF